MSPARLAFAWLLVAALFILVSRFEHGRFDRVTVSSAVLEAALLTALAALWFGSLGHGNWLLVFLLASVLIAGTGRGLRSALLRSGWRSDLRVFLLGVTRILAAGALLAWRLG